MHKFFCCIILVFLLFTSAVNYAQNGLSVNLFGIAKSPVGEFNKLYRGDYSIGGCLSYAIPKTKTELTLSISFGKLGYKNDYLTNYYYSKFKSLLIGFLPDWNANYVPIFVGARYKIYDEGATPYFAGEIGIHFMEFFYRLKGKSVIDTTEGFNILYDLDNYSEGASESGFGFAFGGGLEIPIVDNLYGDIGMKYVFGRLPLFKTMEIINKKKNISNYVPEINNMQYLSFNIGLWIRL